jgi:hypothetical protein
MMHNGSLSSCGGEVKGDGHVSLTSSPPSLCVLSGKCGRLDLSGVNNSNS